jgi:uncharacterized SAM-dependent methyltransferase
MQVIMAVTASQVNGLPRNSCFDIQDFSGQIRFMPPLAHVTVHPSQFPEAVQRDLLQSLRARRIDPKLHYLSYKQAQKWLALHEARSPSRTDADCAGIYDQSFQAVTKILGASKIRVIGLGCGGGQKEARLLSLLEEQGSDVSYTPCDASVALVLTSSNAAQTAVPGIACYPLVCDIGATSDLPKVLDREIGVATLRIVTFFGMIPNFEPEIILPKLAALLRSGDHMLFSANLAPGPDYAAGVEKILPGYDNPETRDWLFTFLHDLGVDPDDGQMEFSIEDSPAGLKRIVVDFHFKKGRILKIEHEMFGFHTGTKIRLFFSCRYTPGRIKSLLAEHKLSILNQWIASSGEEGVFLCGRAGD